MSDPRIEKLTAFVQWSQAHLTGDEKGQAQIFRDRLQPWDTLDYKSRRE